MQHLYHYSLQEKNLHKQVIKQTENYAKQAFYNL